MTSIQIVAVQHPAGRKHEHIVAVGYRTADLKRRIVQVHLNVDDAVDLIKTATETNAYPEIEIADNAWTVCLNTGDLQMVHFTSPTQEPGA